VKIVFFGTPLFAALILQDLLQHNVDVAAVVTQPDRPKGRSLQMRASPVKTIALEKLVPDHKNFQRNLRLDFLCEQGAEDDGNLHQVVESEREAGREKMGQIPNKFCGKVLADGFHPHQAVSLEKALHHLQRVHISNQSKSYSEQISNILTQMQALNEKVKKSAPYTQSAHHYHGVEKIFISMQILSACLVAFAHGANDVANAIGPAAAVFGVLKTQTINASSTVPSWLLALGGIGIIIGLATWGWRVIETVGKKITELTPTRGFAAEFGAATTILLASKLGLPISTTHALIGAVLGVGMARGLKALNLQTLKEIVVSWVVTIPLCALFSMIAFYLLKLLFF
jgi:phosphate/sulfate permease